MESQTMWRHRLSRYPPLIGIVQKTWESFHCSLDTEPQMPAFS
jgi:hypothetical protein